MVHLIGLLAGNPKQPVSPVNNMLCQSQHSTAGHLSHVIGICILDIYVGWLHMCYGVLSMSPSRQTAHLQNSPPNQEFQNVRVILSLASDVIFFFRLR